MDLRQLHDEPASVRVFVEDTTLGIAAERRGDVWSTPSVDVRLTSTSHGVRVGVNSPRGAIARVAIRWSAEFVDGSLFLGDAWERGYGDLQWRGMQSERILPWYFASHDLATRQTVAAGVRTQPAAMCFWTIDARGVTLWLDLRNGGMPSTPGDRWVEAATVVEVSSEANEQPAATIRRLCTAMCETPRPVAQPVCGNNNWYYAYGQNFDADQVRRDAALVAELAGDHVNRPFCVIDAGWSPGGSCPGGPWLAGRPEKFPDMPGLAQDISQLGAKPGIWIRPTALTSVDDPRRLRSGPQKSAEQALDLTLPENLAQIHDDVHRMHAWGFDLIKHDFSTWDALGRWGFEMAGELTDSGWHFDDRSRTNAEIILKLYQTIREAAGDAVLIGCNTIGHLGAGLFELQRAGDDTSGRVWERTRRMGVNTLAFRLPQHGTFFEVDADCVAHTEYTPWEKDRQWLDLVARSGTSLFVSVDPQKISPEVKGAMSSAMRRALSGGPRRAEALDWLTTTAPRRWQFDDETVEYNWDDADGAWPLKV